MRVLASGHSHHCVILQRSFPPLSPLLPHFLPTFHSAQTKLFPTLLIVRERTRSDRRVLRAGAVRGSHWGCPGPPNRAREESAPGGRRAPTSPRLAAPERVGRRGGGEPSGAPEPDEPREAAHCYSTFPLPLQRPSRSASATQTLSLAERLKKRKMLLAWARAPWRWCSQSASPVAPFPRPRSPVRAPLLRVSSLAPRILASRPSRPESSVSQIQL